MSCTIDDVLGRGADLRIAGAFELRDALVVDRHVELERSGRHQVNGSRSHSPHPIARSRSTISSNA